MALATTCPECGTSFRVVPDQLKLRRGLVRCGVCRHVFSGVDGLRYVDDDAATTPADDGITASIADSAPLAEATHEPDHTSPPVVAAEASAPADDDEYVLRAPARRRHSHDDTTASRAEPLPLHADSLPLHADALPLDNEPMTLRSDPLPLRDEARLAHASLGSVEEDDFRIDPPADSPAETEADFLAHRTPPKKPVRQHRALVWVIVIAGTILLAAQLTLAERHRISTLVPAAGPALSLIATKLGLASAAPRDLDALTIESFELQSSGGQPPVYAASAILRNRSARHVRWPAMELSLTDEAGTLVARKVLMPADYLHGTAASEELGIPNDTEVPLRVGLDMTGITPNGYKVNLFYP